MQALLVLLFSASLAGAQTPLLEPAQSTATLRLSESTATIGADSLRTESIKLPPKVDAGKLQADLERNLGAPVAVDAIPVEGTAVPAFVEPPYDESWAPVQKLLAGGPKSQAKAIAQIAARFKVSSETVTGLSEEAPEALRLLSDAIHDKKGGAAAFNELNRQLKNVANLKLPKKHAFAASLRSPRPIYVAIGASHSPHFSDAQAYFQHMQDILVSGYGVKIMDWIRTEDPEQRFSAAFLLRLNVYDALLPYLNRNPSEAKSMAEFLFSEKRSGVIRDRATQIQALALNMGEFARRSGAMDALGEGLLERTAGEEQFVGRRAALFLKLNENLWPKKKGRITQVSSGTIPTELLADPSLVSPLPYEHWPSTYVAVRVHFPSTASYSNWLQFFTTRGYKVDTLSPEGVELRRSVGEVELRVTGRIYQSDDEGFLRDKEKERFLESVRSDLRSPNVQGVIVRTHAQFFYPALFGKHVTKGKFWLDGSCRGAWYQEELEKKCPTCAPVANTATGVGDITDPALYALLDGMAARKDWPGLGAGVKKALPRSSARFLGPWTPRFHTALDLLKTYPPAPSTSIAPSSTR